MDSLLSLQTPTPTTTTSTTTTTTTTTTNTNTNTNTFTHSPPPGITPTPTLLVPKPEPLDDFFYYSQQQQQHPHWLQLQQPQQTQQQTQNHRHHHHHNTHSSSFPSPDTADVSDHDEDSDLYTHFFRVSELFRVAFGDTLHHHLTQNDVVSEPTPDLKNTLFPSPNSQSEDVTPTVSDPNSRAIVPFPALEESKGVTGSAPTKRSSRKKELVRVSDLDVKEQRHFRELVRRTRMIYDSIRVLTVVEDEKRVEAEKRAAFTAPANSATDLDAAEAADVPTVPAEPAPEPPGDQQQPTTSNSSAAAAAAGKLARRVRLRGDLRAAALMRERSLWLNRDKRIVGAIPGVYVGDVFLFRMELCVLGLHGQIQAGIDYLSAGMSPNGEPIATSVIVSGGYEDDMDDGEVLIYTGHGGQDKNSVRQASHQKLEGGNLALERSMYHGIEVRVIRGMKYEGSASKSGKLYVYDGLYRIVDCWFDVGKSGFGVYKYKLVRIEGQAKMGSAVLKDARDNRKGGFDFKPMYCVSVDISNKKEKIPVRLFNDIDDNQDPLYYEYLPATIFPQLVFHRSGKATGCDCVGGCTDDCFCCMKNGGEFPYSQQGFLVRGKPLIFECGPFCTCPPSCRNRVTQNGLKNRLEVFRSRQTGWGVRSLDIIHAGAFLCEYSGVVLTREQAQILAMNGDSLIYPNRFSDRWAEWGDLSQIYPDYVRLSYPSIPPLDFSLDVSTLRNVACYMSHSSSPNVLVQFVLYDHNNLMFPHIMLFAMENIPPMRELSLDYGVADEWTGKLSICNV